MKKATVVLTGGVIAALGLFLLLDNSPGENTPTSEDISSETPSTVGMSRYGSKQWERGEPPKRVTQSQERELPKPTAAEEISITKEQFEQLSPQEQDKMIEAFVAAFWENELATSDGIVAQEKHISLDIFGRPFLRTITESEFFQLSPADQERAMDEIVDSCRQIRLHIQDTIAQAQAGISHNDYARAEACLISALEIGRELNADKDGLLITRVVGIACQRNVLQEMVRLYTETAEYAKVQIAQAQLRDIEIEFDDMRNSAHQAES